MRLRFAILWIAFVAACAAGRRFEPGRLSPAQVHRLAEAERAYRADSPEFPAMRDDLAADPVTAAWLTRLFVRDLLVARERQQGGEDAVLRAAAGKRDPVSQRALAQIVAMGGKAMPCIEGDLLESADGVVRELGVELAGAIGEAALPELRPLLESANPRARRTALRAVAAMRPSPPVLAALRAGISDSDFGVRAAAARGLARGGERDARLLTDLLARDPDPFVRRTAAAALGGHASAGNAEAVVRFLEACERAGDTAGRDAAQQALQRMTRTRGPRTAGDWRGFLERWTPSPDPAGGQPGDGGKR